MYIAAKMIQIIKFPEIKVLIIENTMTKKYGLMIGTNAIALKKLTSIRLIGLKLNISSKIIEKKKCFAIMIKVP